MNKSRDAPLLAVFEKWGLPRTLCALKKAGLSPSFLSRQWERGNVYQIVNNRDNNRTQNFLYDSLNRIQQAYTNGSNWGETFGPTATSPGVPAHHFWPARDYSTKRTKIRICDGV